MTVAWVWCTLEVARTPDLSLSRWGPELSGWNSERTDMCAVQVYRALQAVTHWHWSGQHGDTMSVTSVTSRSLLGQWPVTTVKEWVSSWSQERSWSRPCICTALREWQAGVHQASDSKPISPISDVMWIDLRSAGLRAAWSCLRPLPMLWFTLGINKSRPGSRIGSWIAIWYLHLSSPFLAPTQAVHGRSPAPIYHDIYGMCQTNIQQEIVSWHKFLWVSPDP